MHCVTLAIFRLIKVKMIATLLAFHLTVDKWVSVGKVWAIYIHLVKSSVSFWHDWEQKWKPYDKWPTIASALLAQTCLFELWSEENFIHTVNTFHSLSAVWWECVLFLELLIKKGIVGFHICHLCQTCAGRTICFCCWVKTSSYIQLSWHWEQFVILLVLEVTSNVLFSLRKCIVLYEDAADNVYPNRS